MASRMIGRCACPWCGFGSAHVKESERCTYMFCPECGAQHYAKTERQRADLAAKTRPEPSRAATAPAPVPDPATGAPPAPPPADPATPPATDATATGSKTPAPPASLFGRGLFGSKD